MTPWCTSCAALQLFAPARRRQRTCRRCRAAPHSALLTVHRALSSGYPLDTLRLATSGATAPLFSVHLLEALVRNQPHLFNPVRARADAARLRRERRAALPEMDAFRARVLRTGVPAAFCVGAHADAVARGVLGARRAVRIAAAGAAACRYICGTLAPRIPRHLLGTDAFTRAFRDVCAERLGGFHLFTAAERVGHWPPSASVRAIANGTVRRVLAMPADAEPRPMRMFIHAARVNWSPAVHLMVCPVDTRCIVRALLMHFSRATGVHTGSAFVKAMCVRIFTTEEQGVPTQEQPGGGAVEAPLSHQPVAWGDEPFVPCIQARVSQSASAALPGRRIRFQFLLPPCASEEEGG
jgi:hypothetical protein